MGNQQMNGTRKALNNLRLCCQKPWADCIGGIERHSISDDP